MAAGTIPQRPSRQTMASVNRIADAYETKGEPMAATERAESKYNDTPAGQLAANIDANVPVLLMGAPGTAKTAMIEAMAKDRGAHLEIVIASAQDPTTILGIPMPTEDRKYTEPTMPGWARRVNAAHDAGKPTILFLDEVTTVHESVMGPLLGVVQSRRADGWTIPDDTRIVAAANPPDLAVGGFALPPAMANRWAHIDWPAPHAEWVKWAKSQPSPALQSIAEYIAAVPGELLAVPNDTRKRSGAWPSPRSWTNAAKLIDATGNPGMAALTVGQSAASTYLAWCATRDVPSVDEMLSGAKRLPERHDAFVTALQSLVMAATPDTLDRTIELLRSAVQTDPAVVAVATRTLAKAGHMAGIAPLFADLEAAGVDFGGAK